LRELFEITVTICGGLMTLIAFIKVIFGNQINGYLETRKTVKITQDLLSEVLATNKKQSEDIQSSKEERKLMLEALLGLCRREIEMGANGTVSSIEKKLERYLFDIAHK
jgi:hypothetical protein